MSFRFKAVAAAALSLASLATGGSAQAADLPVKAAKKAPDLPFFLVIDDRVSFSYIFTAAQPGAWSLKPDGTVNAKTAKQVYSFTHFDAWAYGTNFFTISLFKSDQNDPAGPCTSTGVIQDPLNGFATVSAKCAGASEIYGLFRSTLGWNQLFDTKAFSVGPLHNISFEAGMDANTENRYFGAAKRDVVAGLEFAFDLPYKGYFNVSPLVYWEFYNHNSFSQCGAGWDPNNPGVTCLANGNTSYKPTWAIETNYYMDLGFLPENMQYFSISGRMAWYGRKGTDTEGLPYNPANNVYNTKVEFNSEPIRLTMDASKAIWGPKYSHFVDVWVAYRYWQNKFGLDHNAPSIACSATVGGVTRPSGACTESSLYSGITVKF
ncbi:hypothetical protein FXB40_34640 [Bradyrhizobium rifense]|uniref:Uncharacterized protein n=1 Tax=Bradyrhizobium rifense TaxID=515499 RepID=A0A5D3K4S5_9BRAD|nr:hypothetical protein [Bradyrhizobium rifense]TYL89763.1 hypothetical protein FXB40_34640 [Bradyrhizobium rifense]